MEIINSTQNKRIKERAKLLKKKSRDNTHLFLIEGFHLIQEAEKAHALKEVYLLDGLENPTHLEPIYCSQNVLNKLSHQKSDAQIIGVCQKQNEPIQDCEVALFLDCVQDPGNVGTILRTAYSFGVDCVYLSKDCADVYNPKTIQSTKGALFHIPFVYTDLKTTIQAFQKEGMEVYATALHHESIGLQDCHPKKQYGLIVGNEGQGIKEELIQCANQTIFIEMEQFESLNVAIATAIALYTCQHAKA